MAFLEKDHVTVYEKYIQEEFKKHDASKRKVVAHATATIPASLFIQLAAGPAAGFTLQSCVIAATDHRELLIIFTRQIGAETPTVAESFLLSSREVALVNAKRGLLLNSLVVKIQDKSVRFRIPKIIKWNEFDALVSALSPDV